MNDSDLKNKIELIGKELIEEKRYLSTVDVLLKLAYLSQNDYENWRVGKVEYLEKICSVNLKKLVTIRKTIREISMQRNLKNSWTAYNRYGKGKKIRLRFSKSGNELIEKAYSTHFVKATTMKAGLINNGNISKREEMNK